MSGKAPTMTAAEVKDRLRKRYPATQTMGVRQVPGPWTCIEEWHGVDLLAIGATSGGTGYKWIGHEVKISRSDLRRELLRPWKREPYKAITHQLYLVVPKGLLTDDEKAWQQPDHWTPSDFERIQCPGLPYVRGGYGGPCVKWGRGKRKVTVPIPCVSEYLYDDGREAIDCPTCGGSGYLGKSRVEEEAPTCWLPPDLGLIEVAGNGCHVVKEAPTRFDLPKMLDRSFVGELVRWVSARPDPRHVGVVDQARADGREIAALIRGAA